jgi:hypothetical protein
VLQVISVLGALAILIAYAANQFGWMTPSQLSYTVANFLGAGILTVVAILDRQIGFVLLQGGWTLVSLWGIVKILRGGGHRDDCRPAREDPR